MKKLNLLTRIFFAACFVFLAVNFVQAQQDDDTKSRSITSQDFQTQRKSSEQADAGVKSKNAKRKKNIAVITGSKRRYNLVKKIPRKIPITPPKEIPSVKFRNEQLGVTFWRLRPKTADEEDAPTYSVKVNNQIVKWTAERVNSTTKFSKGDKVRFTIESSRTGYIYIVNREFYTDGTTGQAEIIFPTLETRSGGENSVTAGSLIEIPGSEVVFPYFNINSKSNNYAGEEVLVIITPEKLPGIEIGMDALPLRPEIVQKWLQDWLGEVDIFDAADGEGIAQTQAEATTSRSLTQEEPLPQTIFRVRIGTNSPLIISFQMQAQP